MQGFCKVPAIQWSALFLFPGLRSRSKGEARILNIGKLRKGGELYYLNSIARGVEDYYTGSGEAPGYWLAGGSRELELQGEVGEEHLRAVLNGYHPTTGERLINNSLTRRERVPGFDLTFRAPKSVSLVHALGDPESSNEVASAHDAAVSAALAYLEREASHARRGKGGTTRISSTGFIGAAFRHRTSRAGDPLLHTHVLVANLVRGSDGRWGAVDARQLYVQAKTAGYLYQAHLRAELTRRLGLAWGPVHNGVADIEGVPRSVIQAFSQRRQEIEAAIKAEGDTSARSSQVAAIQTRKSKDYGVTPERLMPEWKERAADLGLDEVVLASLVDRVSRVEPILQRSSEIEQELGSAGGLTSQSSSFTRREVIQGFCSRVQSGATVEQLEDLAERFLVTDEVVALAGSAGASDRSPSLTTRNGRSIPVGHEEPRYSTREMLAVEQRVVESAVGRCDERAGIATTEGLEAALATRTSLFPDQDAMVRQLTSSGRGIEVVVGKAGAGKTFALDAAREAWERSGYRVIGCSLSARAAEELQLGSGISSLTIAGLLNELEHPETGGFVPSSVLVVDEAGMVGTRDLEVLFQHAARANTKVVLVGDDRQLPEIQAGGAFRGIKERLGAVELGEVRRQPLGWERAALDMIREGRSKEALASYLDHDRVVIAQSAEETRRRLIADWWATQSDLEPAVMVAAHRSDVSDLNARARTVMSLAGRLGETEIDIGGQRFAAGDRIMTLKNSRHLDVKNGTRGTVQSVHVEQGDIEIRRDDGVLVKLPADYLDAGNLTHAYAITGHKAQGMTASKAYVLGDQTLYREWTYVAMSRGRNENKLYVVAEVDADREELGGQVAGVDDPLEELIAAVRRSRAKDLALDLHQPEGASEIERSGPDDHLDGTLERVIEL